MLRLLGWYAYFVSKFLYYTQNLQSKSRISLDPSFGFFLKLNILIKTNNFFVDQILGNGVLSQTLPSKRQQIIKLLLKNEKSK